MLGPGQLEGHTVRDRTQPVEAVELGERVGESHVVELAHGPRGQAVATRLVARKALLLDDEHAPAALREPVRRSRARRTRADDEHVVPLACAFVHSCLLERAARAFATVVRNARSRR